MLKNVLSANDSLAAKNQLLLDKNGIFAINLMASPGAGKTSLILQTIELLKGRTKIAVVEGDVASNLDADKINDKGISVVQLNTDGSCHLDANLTSNALDNLPLPEIDLLLIENVGNLVCPAEFTLGEHKKAMILSLPEGDDKPYKYPLMFTEVDALVLNKIDLLPFLDFDIAAFYRAINEMNPKAKIFQASCKTGEGVDEWASWLLEEMKVNQERLSEGRISPPS